MKNDRSNLTTVLEGYGAPRDGVVLLDDRSKPEHIRYLDLLRSGLPDEARPDAVVEVRGRPILFVVDTDRPHKLPPLRRALALRADGAFLGIVEPGRLIVRSIELDPRAEREVIVASSGAEQSATVIPELALRPPKTTAQATAVHNLLFDLLDGATSEMTKAGLNAADSLSLSGRALFFRFLVDRQVIGLADITQICPSSAAFDDCFGSPENLAHTSRWLDETFNGDLLPLSSAVDAGDKPWLSGLSISGRKRVCHSLMLIMQRAEASGQLRLDWGDLDFAHVPTGLLSQVYERHSQRYDDAAHQKSIYYTPRAIAEYMVDEAFAAMKTPHAARVLDPAVGGGVFLVAAFRRIVEARWRHDGKRPSTRVIRKILNRQLAGFEINEAALRLTALSLYLTALELDPHPHPLNELRFDDLRGTVLFDVRTGNGDAYELGSLGPQVADTHTGSYDLVVGNPPWTALKRLDTYRTAVLEALRPVVEQKLGSERASTFTVADDVPDIAFLWRSFGWAKPDGHIAFAVHARLLFKQTAGGRQTREDLFRAVQVTGILNGAAVRQTDVWPKVDAPFALIFARNAKPEMTSGFYYVSPDRDDVANRRGTLRIDPNAALVITQSEAIRVPHILKALFRGTTLDLAVLDKISHRGTTTLEDYWRELDLESGQGYQLGGKAREQQDATALHGLPTLTKNEFSEYRVNAQGLPRFSRTTLLYPRRREIYRAPIVLIPESPSPERKVPRAALASEDVAFNESFYGYSTVGYHDPELLARYLLLLLNSQLPIYTALLTSGKFGAERDVLHKADLERLPMIRLDELRDVQRDSIKPLSDAVLADRADWNAIDAFIAQLYGLNKWDREVISDTLATASPFAASRRRAQTSPSATDIGLFARRLAHDLRPFLETPIEVRRAVTRHLAPWSWLFLGSGDFTFDTREIIQTADELAATQIIACPPGGGVAVGILAQQRYWTPTRARLLALTLLHDEVASKRICTDDGA